MHVNCLAISLSMMFAKACHVLISERDSISVSQDQSKPNSELMIPF